MDSLEGKTLIRKSGDEVSVSEALEGVDIIGYYFSAHWCPPCRMFTPVLAEFYTELKSKEEKFEIVFVSSDRSATDMMQYMKDDHGDWLAVPFSGPLFQELKSKYEVRGIPSLIVVTREGKIITTDGRSDVHKNGTNCYRAWTQKAAELKN